MATVYKLTLATSFVLLAAKAEIPAKIIAETRAKGIIWIGNDFDRTLVDFAETIPLQYMENTTFATSVLEVPIDSNFLIMLSLDNPGKASDLLAIVNQYNFIHSTWLLIGSNQSLLDTTMLKLFANRKFRGFSPHAKMFFVPDCLLHSNCNELVIQIFGSGSVKPTYKVKHQFIAFKYQS